MTNFRIHQNCVEIFTNDGRVVPIYFNEHSGNVYYRYKKGSPSNIKHPGIYLGVDANGIQYVLHNHYKQKRAFIDTLEGFSLGRKLRVYNTCTNPPHEVIRIGLEQVLNGEKYKVMSYNCQTFTNQACHNVRKSESIEDWKLGLGIGALVLGVFGIAFSGD
jgi:hypothetical protein